MLGLMTQPTLLVSNLLSHAERRHGSTNVVSRTIEGKSQSSSYGELHQRTRQLANALTQLGMRQGERVAILDSNSPHHLESHFAISCSGAVVVTVNPSLPEEHIVHILKDAEVGVLLFAPPFAPLIARIKKTGLVPHIRHFVLMSDRSHAPTDFPAELLVYEDLLQAHSADFEWPQFDENCAAFLCYTPVPGGLPKGVPYSHRYALLQAYASSLPDRYCLSVRDVLLPVIPTYHADAWGLLYSALLVGAKLILPGPTIDGQSLLDVIVSEGATVAAGSPEIWQAVLQLATEKLRAGHTIGRLNRLLISGSACPPAMIEAFMDHDVRVLHAWGVTEASLISDLRASTNEHSPVVSSE